MTPPADIGEVADMTNRDPIAEVASLIAKDLTGLSDGDVPFIPNPLRFGTFSRPFGIIGTSAGRKMKGFGQQFKKGNLGIGTTSPAVGYKLDVEGAIQATTFDVGDITFTDQATQKILWRMFEDEDGLYLENAKTGKVYRFLLQEVENK